MGDRLVVVVLAATSFAVAVIVLRAVPSLLSVLRGAILLAVLVGACVVLTGLAARLWGWVAASMDWRG